MPSDSSSQAIRRRRSVLVSVWIDSPSSGDTCTRSRRSMLSTSFFCRSKNWSRRPSTLSEASLTPVVASTIRASMRSVSSLT